MVSDHSENSVTKEWQLKVQKAAVSEIRESVNPVFKTARSCVIFTALLGDADAQKLMNLLGFDRTFLFPGDGKMTAEMREFAAQMSNPGFSIMIETRFSATNKFILDSGINNVVDLPCGFTPRGVKFKDAGLRYFGLDIPAVTDEIAQAVREVIGENDLIRYFDVDATNQASLKKSLTDVHGELLITTEGLLMYLTQSELDEVFHNIHALLKNFGGKWITTDNEILAAHYRLQSVLSAENSMKPPAEQTHPPFVPGNDFLTASTACQYVEKMGFNLRKIPVFTYLPDSLLSLSQMSEEKRTAVRDSFREMFFWVMTVKDGSFHGKDDAIPFSVRADLTDDKLSLVISGRLDTITSPELLSIYLEESAKHAVRSITIDLGTLTYISSAGLRVFVIMRKGLADGDQFRLKNMNESVREIMDETGFADLFVIEH